MSSFDRLHRIRIILGAILIASCSASLLAATPNKTTHVDFGVGRPATPAEIKAWDIDVRPDFKGLPKGSGSVSLGQDVWEGKCASCHGTFAESNEVFTPLVGGTTADDIKTGHTRALATGSAPQRTTIMKVATLSTLWDYINRAMPWTAPKSLTTDEVYGVLAFLLNLAEIVPADFVLSDQNIAEVQKRMPNRNGMTTAHGLWDVKGKPDVNGSNCMHNCRATVAVSSQLPEVARNAHGNIAEQNRSFGAIRGADTSRPAGAVALVAATKTEAPKPVTGSELFGKNSCLSCHAKASKLVGPSWEQIATRYKDSTGAEDKLVAKVKSGGAGVWGNIPMPAHAHVSENDIRQMVKLILSGAR
ncbi:MAG: c-type cytochrome [Verrucomicrobia bacterium]|nr:MAG: c-type cytochrome [Verrucomicrobiota bacterium]